MGTLIPHQHDRAAEMPQQGAHEHADLDRPDIAGMDMHVEAEALAAPAESHSGNRGDFVGRSQ
jgi:hypothetical protein